MSRKIQRGLQMVSLVACLTLLITMLAQTKVWAQSEPGASLNACKIKDDETLGNLVGRIFSGVLNAAISRSAGALTAAAPAAGTAISAGGLLLNFASDKISEALFPSPEITADKIWNCLKGEVENLVDRKIDAEVSSYIENSFNSIKSSDDQFVEAEREFSGDVAMRGLQAAQADMRARYIATESNIATQVHAMQLGTATLESLEVTLPIFVRAATIHLGVLLDVINNKQAWNVSSAEIKAARGKIDDLVDDPGFAAGNFSVECPDTSHDKKTYAKWARCLYREGRAQVEKITFDNPYRGAFFAHYLGPDERAEKMGQTAANAAGEAAYDRYMDVNAIDIVSTWMKLSTKNESPVPDDPKYRQMYAGPFGIATLDGGLLNGNDGPLIGREGSRTPFVDNPVKHRISAVEINCVKSGKYSYVRGIKVLHEGDREWPKTWLGLDPDPTPKNNEMVTLKAGPDEPILGASGRIGARLYELTFYTRIHHAGCGRANLVNFELLHASRSGFQDFNVGFVENKFEAGFEDNELSSINITKLDKSGSRAGVQGIIFGFRPTDTRIVNLWRGLDLSLGSPIKTGTGAG